MNRGLPKKNPGELILGSMRNNEFLAKQAGGERGLYYKIYPPFLVGIIRLAIRALELFISKVLLVAAKVAERVVDNVHEKVVEKVVSMVAMGNLCN